MHNAEVHHSSIKSECLQAKPDPVIFKISQMIPMIEKHAVSWLTNEALLIHPPNLREQLKMQWFLDFIMQNFSLG
jgi:hypothetical protein